MKCIIFLTVLMLVARCAWEQTPSQRVTDKPSSDPAVQRTQVTTGTLALATYRLSFINCEWTWAASSFGTKLRYEFRDPCKANARKVSKKTGIPIGVLIGGKETAPERHHVPVAWLVLNGLQAGALVADVEGTQHCLKAHTCVEGNPLMPSSRGGAYGVGFSIEGLSAGASWLVRKHRGWWALPLEGVGVHAAGAVSGWSK